MASYHLQCILLVIPSTNLKLMRRQVFHIWQKIEDLVQESLICVEVEPMVDLAHFKVLRFAILD